MPKWIGVPALALLAAAGACAHHVATPVQLPALAGRWVPVPGDTAAHADSARDNAAAHAADAPLPPVGGERRGARRGGERAEETSARFDGDAFGGVLAIVRRGSERFTIAQTDSTVHFAFADGSYFDLPTDGRRRDDIWRGIGRIEASARWTIDGLVFERKVEEGVTISQTYARSPGADRLVVTTVVKGGAQGLRPITVRRVFQPATS